MEVFGLAGWSGSGKTTLLKRLIPVLISKGISEIRNVMFSILELNQNN